MWRLHGITLRLGGLAGSLLLAVPLPVQAGDPPRPTHLASGASGGATSEGDRTSEVSRLTRMAAVQRWGYQLDRLNPFEIAASDFDLVVVDHAVAPKRRFVRELSPREVSVMRKKPDGSSRVVLAYLSVGEAERYRFYWQDDWSFPELAPAWLGPENPRWSGNYRAAFWNPDWQKLLFGAPGSYLDRLIDQGFDGIYVDRADIYDEWAKEVPDAEQRMADMLKRLIAHARLRKPEFLVVIQNGEELLKRSEILTAIDGFAKEDLFYGISHKETANAPSDVEWSSGLLRQAQAAGRRVLVVEYLSDPDVAHATAEKIAALGFVPHIARRELDRLNHEATPAPQTPPGGTAASAQSR